MVSELTQLGVNLPTPFMVSSLMALHMVSSDSIEFGEYHTAPKQSCPIRRTLHAVVIVRTYAFPVLLVMRHIVHDRMMRLVRISSM
jgi:hypothetical protein